MGNYQLQSPIGTFTGTREEIRELAELYPSESLIKHPDWKGTKTFDSFIDQYKPAGIFWGWKMDDESTMGANLRTIEEPKVLLIISAPESLHIPCHSKKSYNKFFWM